MVNFKNLAIAASTLFGLAQAAPIVESQGEIIPDSYIITLKPDIEVEASVAWISDVHKRSLGKRDTKGVEITYDGSEGLHGYAGTFDKDTVEELKKSPDVVAIEENRVWTIDFNPTVEESLTLDKRAPASQSGAPWGLGTVSHRTTGSTTYLYDNTAGTGTYAYIVDTGIRDTHTEFEGRATRAWSYWSNDVADTYGHGTHVAGTIAGKTYGVAKKASVLAVKVFQGSSSSTSIILAGYNWAINDIVEKGRTGNSVINLSLGGAVSTTFNNLVAEGSTKGVISVVAAGNDAANANTKSPASAPTAITVGAIDSTWAIASYSNWGPILDVFAPGSGVLSALHTSDSASGTNSGTSMASPHVAGLVLYANSVYGVSGVTPVTNWIIDSSTKNAVTGNLRSSPNRIANNNNAQQ